MDPLSHAAFGAAWAQSANPSRTLAAATTVGAISSLAPDLDVLIRSGSDPLIALEFHRHFTHSLLFIPAGSLVCALLLFPLCRRWLSFRVCATACLLGYASHGLLDACTSYGTELFWPFSRERIALGIISAVDPLVTFPLLALVSYGAWRRRPVFAALGIGYVLAYLGAGWVQQGRALDAARELAVSRGHAAERFAITPSFGNIVLWRSIYEAAGAFHVDAVRVGVAPHIFEGVRLPKADASRDFPWLEPDSEQQRDVERLERLALGFLALDEQNPNRIVDIRYALVPNQAGGFWGLELDPGRSRDAHAAYVTMRIRSLAEGRELIAMLFQGETVE